MSNNPQKTNLAERFSTFGSTPSDSVWKGIDAQLSAREGKNKGLILWLLANAAMIGLIVVAYSMYSEKSELTPESALFSTKASGEDSVQPSTKEPKNETSKSSEKKEVEHFNEYDQATPTPLFYGENPFLTSSFRERKPTLENVFPLSSSPEVLPSSSESLLSTADLDLLETEKVHSLHSNIDRSIVPCMIIFPRKLATFEIGARIATFSETRSEDRILFGDELDQASVTNPTAGANQYDYAQNRGHQRPFEFEIFARMHYRRFYGTLGFSAAKTNVRELYGISSSFMREFVSKEITSIGMPASVGYNIIDRTRFQFALSARLIPEYSLLTKYEKLVDQPGITTSIPSQQSSTSPEPSETTTAVTLGFEPHLSMNFKLNERFDLFGQFGYRAGLVRSPLFSPYFTPNFTTFSFGTVVRL